MYSERLVVEEVGSSAYELQLVQEVETLLFRLEVDGEHGSQRLAKRESGIVHALHLWQFLQGVCQVECVLGLFSVAHVQRL